MRKLVSNFFNKENQTTNYVISIDKLNSDKLIKNLEKFDNEILNYNLSVQIDTEWKKTRIKITFKHGDPTSINGKKLSPEKLLDKLNLLAGKTDMTWHENLTWHLTLDTW